MKPAAIVLVQQEAVSNPVDGDKKQMNGTVQVIICDRHMLVFNSGTKETGETAAILPEAGQGSILLLRIKAEIEDGLAAGGFGSFQCDISAFNGKGEMVSDDQ